MLKKLICFIFGHERGNKLHILSFTDDKGNEISVGHEYQCSKCKKWILL